MKKNQNNINLEYLNRKTLKRIELIILITLLVIIAEVAVFAHSDIRLVDRGDTQYVLRESGNSSGSIGLRATITLPSGEIDKDIDFAIKPDTNHSDTAESEGRNSSMTSEELALFELQQVMSELSEDNKKKYIRLPSTLPSGYEVHWQENKRSIIPLIIIIAVILSIAVYTSRLKPIKEKRKSEFESVKKQLPEFINRLVLLLGAGMVLSNAFEKTVTDGAEYSSDKNDYFYTNMQHLYDSSRTTNESLVSAFNNFACRSGVTEMIRISNILFDNLNKGVALTQKLERESQVLWLNRKRDAEEKARLSETKLTLPLTIFLMVLIIITIAPALLEL